VAGRLSTRLNRTKARRVRRIIETRPAAAVRIGSQDSQIWIARVLISIVPTSDQNGGNVRGAPGED
jgi:hypothetical protein